MYLNGSDSRAYDAPFVRVFWKIQRNCLAVMFSVQRVFKVGVDIFGIIFSIITV